MVCFPGGDLNRFLFLCRISNGISLEDNLRLNEPVLDLEIWNAAKSIGALKAPGPDGLGASFFREC